MSGTRWYMTLLALALPAAAAAGNCEAPEGAPSPPLASNAFVFERATADASPVGLLEPGRRVPLVSWAGAGYWEICLDGMRGFVKDADVAPDAAEAEALAALRGDDGEPGRTPSTAPEAADANQGTERTESAEAEARRKRLTARWGREIAAAIMEGAVWRGMSIRMARESAGRPDHVRKWGLAQQMHEEWRYLDRNLKLVFLNGKLVSAEDDEPDEEG